MEQDGKCVGIRFRKCLSVKNDEGRFDPRFDDAVTEETACDVVLYCIGQKVEWKELLVGTKVEFNPNGTVKADPVTYQTASRISSWAVMPIPARSLPSTPSPPASRVRYPCIAGCSTPR